VRQVVVSAGDRLMAVPEYEPHATWRVEPKPKKNEPSMKPRRVQPGRSAWQGLESLLAMPDPSRQRPFETSRLLAAIADGGIDGAFPLGVEMAGVEYGTQSAVVENIIEDVIPLPVMCLRADDRFVEPVERLVADTDGLAKAIDILEADVRRASGGEPIPWDKGQRASAVLVQALDEPARRVLADLQRQPDAYGAIGTRWRNRARLLATEVADAVLASAPPSAFMGRPAGGNSTRVIRLAGAERRFRVSLNEVLGPPERGPVSGEDSSEAI
jgi:CRISPR system Cascade subunit CasA